MRMPFAKLLQQQLASLASTSPDSCALKQLVDCAGLPQEVRFSMQSAATAGFTLRTSLPRINERMVTEWLGERWWFIHRSQLAHTERWTGIIGSRLDRTAVDFSQWPVWIENAIRSLALDRRTLMLVAKSTTAAILEPLARQAELDCLRVQLPESNHRTGAPIGAWLLQCLGQCAANPKIATGTLALSAALNTEASQLEHLPLRDRVIVALAHRVLALSIRASGNIAELLAQRLDDSRFPEATVAVRISDGRLLPNSHWLDKQAVGWYWPPRTLPNPMHNPNNYTRSGIDLFALVQLTASSQLWSRPDYLIHCVRGDDGAAFRDGTKEAVIDAIVRGELVTASPLETLLKIVHSRRLRASGKLLRSGTTAVSFTAVPLNDLMQRRRYQSHLGRWDWEPYGLLIRRDVLEQMGARPVIYGDEELFEHLDEADRPYYQPAQRRSARDEDEHWRSEQEWRLLDDVRLNELPPQSLILFVEYAAQAQAFAARYPWPVIWLRANQTDSSPISPKIRRQRLARTGKS